MPYDSLALAVDWLDAYRGKSLDLVDMYHKDAVLFCGCGSEQEIVGTAALDLYWRARFEQTPALELVDLLRHGEDVVSVIYRTPLDEVEAVLGFDAASGKISWQRCGPPEQR